MKINSTLKTLTAAVTLGAVLLAPGLSFAAEPGANAKTQSITGEVVDLMCYMDHGAKGEKHAKCAKKCIENGGPVGLLSGDQLYLVVGNHEPMNEKLAPKAGETVTLKGKVVERNGMKMIQNAEIAS